MPETFSVPLTQGRFALVDAIDAECVMQHKWCVADYRGSCYAVGWVDGKQIKLHRFLLNAPDGVMVDHKNHNPLDNRRENIRLCTNSQNQQNRLKRRGVTSQFKGVMWSKKNHRWMAYIYRDGDQEYLGSFLREEDAAETYRKRAVELFGEFAHLIDK